MPTYVFRCNKDGSNFEIQQGFYDNNVPNCPLCGQEMYKVIQPTPAIFRGGGWGGSK